MPLPISGTQLKKLTKRLREGTETPEDLHALADVLLYYRQVLERAHGDVVRLCAEIQHAEPTAPRVKTLKTTMEKLHRQPDLHSLAQIRDLAGLRVVVDGTRAEQDEIAARIGASLSDGDRPPKLIDRRADPRAGYRAVHVEVRREGILIEVQVRTGLQHRWAELFERTADHLGRGLRYGEPISLGPHARPLVNILEEASVMINFVEEGAITRRDRARDTRPVREGAAVKTVIHVVLVYRREAGELLLQESYADGDTAMRRRFALERMPEYADLEIVVLSADSEETLRETHGRYFFTTAELARRLRDAVTAA